METPNPPPRPIALLLIAVSAVVGGALIGASTNAINGVVSPTYFRNVMRWQDVENIHRAAIAQGIFEGLSYGVLFAVVYTMVVGIVSRARCTYAFALRRMLGMIAAIYGCWVVGGVIAIGLAVLSPEFYCHAFNGVPETFGPMLRYAWVGGSILGGLFGGVLTITIGSVLFAVRWRQSCLATEKH